jgi:hypothetical protein
MDIRANIGKKLFFDESAKTFKRSNRTQNNTAYSYLFN